MQKGASFDMEAVKEQIQAHMERMQSNQTRTNQEGKIAGISLTSSGGIEAKRKGRRRG
jgi:hypothetical protein